MKTINYTELEQEVFQNKKTYNVPVLFVMQTLLAVEDYLDKEGYIDVSAIKPNADDTTI